MYVCLCLSSSGAVQQHFCNTCLQWHICSRCILDQLSKQVKGSKNDFRVYIYTVLNNYQTRRYTAVRQQESNPLQAVIYSLRRHTHNLLEPSVSIYYMKQWRSLKLCHLHMNFNEQWITAFFTLD